MAQVVKITFDDLKPYPKQSVSVWCREALKKGMNPNARVEVYRNGSDRWDLAVKCIADGAKLTLREDCVNGPRFDKYMPFPASG